MNKLYSKIGEKLRAARNKAGLTQTQVEQILGLNQAQLSYYENGRREISITMLEKLSSLYGYSVKYFLEDVEDDTYDYQLAFRTSELTEEDIREIEWAKEFLTNLYEMNIIKGKE